MPQNDAGAHGEIAAPGGQRAQLQERGIRIQQQLDPLTGGELAAAVMAVHIPGPPPARALACSASSSAELGGHHLGRLGETR